MARSAAGGREPTGEGEHRRHGREVKLCVRDGARAGSRSLGLERERVGEQLRRTGRARTGRESWAGRPDEAEERGRCVPGPCARPPAPPGAGIPRRSSVGYLASTATLKLRAAATSQPRWSRAPTRQHQKLVATPATASVS